VLRLGEEAVVDDLNTPSGESAPETVGPEFVYPALGRDAHVTADDTATEGAFLVSNPAEEPTVGAAAYLGEAAQPPPPPPDQWLDARPFETSGPVPKPSRGTGPNWVVGLLIASLIGGLIGAGLVALVDHNDGNGRVNTAFSSNGSKLAKAQDIQSLLARVEPAVVSIRTQAFQRGFFGDAVPAAGAGTGMIITSDGNVLTNAHVVRGATSIKITLFNEKDPRDADLVGADPAADVAVVHIRGAKDLPTVRFGSSTDAKVGDDVVAIGNALALPGGPSVTSGIVSAKDRAIGAEDEQLQGLIQTDAAINPGNSGGPLVNASGEVIGMNTAVIQQTGEAIAQNIGFAIAIDTIKPLVKQLEKGGGGTQATTSFLGVLSQTMTPQIKQNYGLSVDKGAIVVEVTAGSPAENAGIQVADVITKLGGDDIATNAELVSAVRAHKPGDKVEVTYVRGSDTHKATVVIGSRPAGR
jgi:serine protease Do